MTDIEIWSHNIHQVQVVLFNLAVDLSSEAKKDKLLVCLAQDSCMFVKLNSKVLDWKVSFPKNSKEWQRAAIAGNNVDLWFRHTTLPPVLQNLIERFASSYLHTLVAILE